MRASFRYSDLKLSHEFLFLIFIGNISVYGAKKYHWLLNSYGGNQILTADYFDERLRELLKEKPAKEKIKEIQKIIKNNKQRKGQLIKKLGMNKEVVLMAEQLAQSIWWQDLRKGYIWRMHYFWDMLLKAVEKNTDWTLDNLLWCWPEEVIRILQNKKVDKQKILSRNRYYAVYLGKGKMKHIYGERVKRLFAMYQPSAQKGINELKGLVVSRGALVRGRVKIIMDPFRELAKMKKGDILVASMTSPEFIVAMRKAAAIVTDAGGMTSHAAVVSRELGVPCIVGTKIATQIFKDEDMVEVDTEKGVVRKIE